LENGDLSVPTSAPVGTPTKAPLPPPTKAPVSLPTKAPVPVPTPRPTNAPVVAPTDAPVTGAPITDAPVTPSPTRAPVVPPTFPPTELPSAAPVTDAPVVTPTEPPVTDAPVTDAPVVVPTDAPVVGPTEAPVVVPAGTLLEIVQATPELSTLLTAIETADANRNIPPYLEEALSGSDELTVFAPINAGFDALETVVPGYLGLLLTPEFGLHLFSILAYHVTPGALTTATFPVADLTMLAEGTVDVTGTADAGFSVVSSSPVSALILEPLDIQATNGIAHLVDNVLVPRFVQENLYSALLFFQETQGDNFSTLLRLIDAAGLQTTLAEAEGVTLLAPTNAAIPAETEQFLLAPGNEDILNATISYHIINEVFNYAAQSIPNILLVESLQGENIVVGLVTSGPDDVAVSYNQATQQGFFPVQLSLGYVIDRILVPPSLSTVVPRSSANSFRDPTISIEFSSATTQEASIISEYDVIPEDAEDLVEPMGDVKDLVEPMGDAESLDEDVTSESKSGLPPPPPIRKNTGWHATVRLIPHDDNQ